VAIMLKTKRAQDAVRDLVVENWRQFKDERADLELLWMRCLMSYLAKFDKAWADYAKQAGRSCRYVALNWDAIETVTPQVYESVFGPVDWLGILPVRAQFDERDDLWAQGVKALLGFQFERGKFREIARVGLKQLTMLGNCPWSMTWREQRVVNYATYTDEMAQWVEKVAARQKEVEGVRQEYEAMVIASQLAGMPPPEAPQFTEIPEPPADMDLVFQGPVLQIGDIFNYVQEQHPDDDEMAVRVMRSWRTREYLKKIAKKDETGYVLYENLDKIQETESEQRASQNDGETLLKAALGMAMPQHKDKIEMKEMHGTYEIPHGDDGGRQLLENWITVVGNDNTLMRCEPAPLKNTPLLQNARLITMRGAVYGIGILEKAMDEQDSANAIHNQNIDAVACVIQPEYEVVHDWLAGPMKPSGPAARHSVLQPGAIRPIEKNFTGIPLGFESLNASVSRHERITGAVNTAQGSSETATRTSRNSGIISTKLGGHVVSAEDSLITPAVNMAIEMNALYILRQQIVPIIQDKKIIDAMKVPLEAIRRGWVAKAAGSKFIAEHQKRVENLMMAVQISTQNASPDGRPSRIDEDVLWRLLFKEILQDESAAVLKDPKRFAQEMAQWQQMMQMQSMQQQGAPGGPVPAGAGR